MQGLRSPSGITSAAFAPRAPAGEIRKAATWSSFSTLVEHCRIDQFQAMQAALGRCALQQVLE